MLAVDPGARRRGIARTLVRACVDRARHAGARRLWLSSGRSMTAAHALYASMGFVRTPDRDWEPEPGDRLLTFALDLRSGDEAELP
jgi:ribosomal protein S18 acetylase RimI-like enzyme